MCSKSRRPNSQMFLPGIGVVQVGTKRIPMRNQRIPHKRILIALQQSADTSCNFVEIYRSQVLPVRTRTIPLLGRKTPARVVRTLLGYEVQGSYKRIQCPDMITARYLKLFMELGCHSIKLPYDPTRTAQLLPDLEDALENIGRAIRKMFAGAPRLQSYVTRRVYLHLRAQLKASEVPTR